MLLLLIACSASPECLSHADCGLSQACLGELGEGVCETVECLDSSVCEFGRYCADTFTCEPGCQKESDCGAGYVCSSGGSCDPLESCDDSQTDCGLGEDCIASSCRSDDQICGGCGDCDSPNGCYYGTCYRTCAVQSQCPSGFSCFSGFCVSDCEWLNEHGYL